jgi:hypothetical protein
MIKPLKGLATVAVAGLLFVVSMSGAPPPAGPGAIIFQPVESYDRGQPLTLKAMTGEKPEWITFFFRSSATAEFTARVMETDGANGYTATLDGDELMAEQLEYYLAYKVQGQIRYLPDDVPGRFFSAQASTNPLPALAAVAEVVAAAPRSTRFTLALDGSASQRLGEGDGPGSEPSFQQGENLRLTFQAGHPSLQVLFDARLRYSNLPVNGQKEFNFADGRLLVNLKGHSLQAGVLTLPGSELGLQPFGRRGVAYSFSGAAWQLELFTLATQQLPGFDGFIVPREGAGLFGASLGFSLLNRSVSVRATGLSGRDDPALGINTGFAQAAKARKGDLLSLNAVASLWKNSLTLGSELALSRCDLDTADSQPSASDSAWRVAGGYARGILELHASLKNIGPDFNSIGQQFLVSDRRSLDAGIGLRFAGLNLSAAYQAQRNNTENDSAVASATDNQVKATLGWNFSSKGSLQLAYAHGDLNLPATPLSPIGGGVVKDGYSGTLSWRPGRQASLQFSAQRDVFSSAVDPSLDGRSLTVNAGGNFQRPDRFILGCQLGATLARYAATQKEGRFYYAYVNGELALIARLLSLSLTTAYNRSEPGSGDSQSSLSVDGGIVLKTPPRWKTGLAMVALRGSWLQNRTADVQTDSSRIYIKCDFSLGGK